MKISMVDMVAAAMVLAFVGVFYRPLLGISVILVIVVCSILTIMLFSVVIHWFTSLFSKARKADTTIMGVSGEKVS